MKSHRKHWAKSSISYVKVWVEKLFRNSFENCSDPLIIVACKCLLISVLSSFLAASLFPFQDGHIVHHLTFIAGMDPKKFETLDPNDARKLVNPETFGRVKEKASKTEGSMWMGVFKSPMVKGLHRHVDIKFYPYSERVYATLYFTGNGYFNRSMRLWATKKHKLKLSDHGLFTELKLPALENHPNSEKEVFDRLGLKWKEPHQRNYFDDVISSTPGEEMAVMEMDFSRED